MSCNKCNKIIELIEEELKNKEEETPMGYDEEYQSASDYLSGEVSALSHILDTVKELVESK